MFSPLYLRAHGHRPSRAEDQRRARTELVARAYHARLPGETIARAIARLALQERHPGETPAQIAARLDAQERAEAERARIARARLAAAQIARPVDPEQKARVSATLRAAWERRRARQPPPAP